jgi:hypothetical protein
MTSALFHYSEMLYLKSACALLSGCSKSLKSRQDIRFSRTPAVVPKLHNPLPELLVQGSWKFDVSNYDTMCDSVSAFVLIHACDCFSSLTRISISGKLIFSKNIFYTEKNKLLENNL